MGPQLSAGNVRQNAPAWTIVGKMEREHSLPILSATRAVDSIILCTALSQATVNSTTEHDHSKQTVHVILSHKILFLSLALSGSSASARGSRMWSSEWIRNSSTNIQAHQASKHVLWILKSPFSKAWGLTLQKKKKHGACCSVATRIALPVMANMETLSQ